MSKLPLMKDSIPIIQDYLKMMGYQSPEKLDEWLFINHMGRQFTGQGVNYIIKKYGAMARESSPDLIPDSLSPHKMRHTAAMELVDSGVDLIYIRDLLGHVSVKTTEIYAKTDAKLKREANKLPRSKLRGISLDLASLGIFVKRSKLRGIRPVSD